MIRRMKRQAKRRHCVRRDHYGQRSFRADVPSVSAEDFAAVAKIIRISEKAGRDARAAITFLNTLDDPAVKP